MVRLARPILCMSMLMLAGCVSDAPEVQSDPGEEPGGGDAGFDAMPAPTADDEAGPSSTAPTADDWFLFPLEASAAGSLAGFQLAIPAGAAVPAWFDEAELVPIIEFHVVGNGSLDAFHLIALSPETGAVAGEVLQTNAQGQGFPPGPISATVSINQWTTSTHVTGDLLWLDGMEEGDRVAFAVGAVGSGDATVGIRFLDADPYTSDEPEWPARDRDEFMGRVSDGTAWVAEGTGTGSGMHIDLFFEMNRMYSPSWSRLVAGAMAVTDAMPAAPARAANMITAMSAPGTAAKYSSVAGLIWTEAHAGSAELEMAGPGGQSAGAGGLVVPNPSVSIKAALLRAEGDGDPSARLAVTDAGSPTVFPHLMFLVQVRLGADMQDLVGVPVEEQLFGYDGSPVVRHDERRLQVRAVT